MAPGVCESSSGANFYTDSLKQQKALDILQSLLFNYISVSYFIASATASLRA